MEFGVLLTSHPNPKEEPYPHRGMHRRTTEEVIEAERLGYDTAWIAERVIPAFRPPARRVAAAE